jgi:F-type H+-transporting ATPase subunit b
MKNFCIAFCIAIIIYSNQALGSEAGMPQLNPEFWLAQTFWLIFIFSTLYLIIWKIFLPKITYSIENRKSRIVNDLDQAQKLKENTEKKLKEYDKIIEDSKKEAKKIIEDGKKKLDEEIDNKKKILNQDIEKELLIAEKEIKNLKENSIESINKIAVETSTEIIKQIIDTDVNKSNVSAIVDDIIKKKVEKHI